MHSLTTRAPQTHRIRHHRQSFSPIMAAAAELTQGGCDVVYSPRTLQVWRALLSWLGFFFQIFLQILRALGHLPLLSSSSSSSSASFKPLPNIELPEHDLPADSAVQIAALPDSDSDGLAEKKKLTVLTFTRLEFLICDFNSSC